MKTDVIIPARGETLQTLLPTLTAFRVQPLCGRIFVVDDGLSSEVIDGIRYKCRLIGGPRQGKGQAVMAALPLVETERVAFCDGDLYGVRPEHVKGLLHPWSGLTLALTHAIPGHPPYPVNVHTRVLVTGERCLPVRIVRDLKLHGYCMEVQINAACQRANLNRQIIGWNGVQGTGRWDQNRRDERDRDLKWLNENLPL